ncbi:ARM repeat-containing protein [Hymenopellis radicata]|nr:ARM repeat-containing protein [Hymenopellis radicata]
MHSYSSGPPAYEASPPSPTLPAPTLPAPSRSSSLCAPVPTRLEAPPAVLLDGDFRSSSPGSSSLLPSVSLRSSAAVPNASQRVASPPTSSTFSRQGSIFVASGRSSRTSDSASSWDPSSSYARAYTPNVSSIDENGAYNPMSAPAAPGMLGRSDSSAMWEHNRRQSSAANWDRMSTVTDTPSNRSINQSMNAVLLAGALQAEVHSTRIPDVIDSALIKIQHLATNSDKDAQKLVTAGVVPTLIHLLKIRAAETTGLDIVLVTLGLVAHDPISSNTIFRTNTTHTLLEIFKASISEDISTLALWCLNRICRSTDVALGLLKQNFARLLIEQGLAPDTPPSTARMACWTLGILIHSDAIADTLADMHAVPEIVDYLRRASSVDGPSADVCAAMYAVGRISRSIKLAKALHKAGCVPLLAFHLSSSTEPGVLLWTARAVGCLMRPNSGDMAKILLEADIAHGLARLPSVLPTDEVEPLGSFAFAVQRFSCAEWGSGTRKALVEAGVVDALLAGLRTVADEPHPQIHIEMALAVSFLGDVGGGSIRKEIVSAGGITILKRVGANGSPEVAKACSMAVTSITGNIWTRNAASAKTAMSHNWSGGCPDYHCSCPVPLMDIDTVLGSL